MFKVPGVLLSQSNHKVLFNFKSIKLKHQLTTPQGYDSGIEVYCRIRQKNVPLILLNRHFVKWYICGPTVYDSVHIGHASCYIRFDIINRILKEFFNINPVVALGITDVDDKIIKRSLRKKVDFRFLAKQFELEFFDHLNKLNVLPPSFVLRVSDHIPDIISFISKIIEKGDAYPTEDGSVYFNNPEPVENFKLIHSSLKIGQKSHSDFALWKGAKIDEPYWDSPWGRGRPGWHIECSAMASKIFGSQLDLHGGGNDLWFPHHANEEKQSCSYHGCNQWVNYWLYTGLLHITNVKMSKSLQNFITVSEFLKSHTPDHLRMFSFITKYNLALHWDPNAMSVPVNSCEAISKFLGDADAYVRGNWTVGNVSESALLQELEETKKRVKMHLANDFDTHSCHNDLMKLMKSTLAMMSDLSNVSTSRSPAAVAVVSEYIRDIYTSFGFQLKAVDTSRASAENKKLEFVIDQVINFRSQVRVEALSSEDKSTKGVLLNACDTLRKDLEAVGIVIKDFGKDNTSWSFAKKGEKTAESAGA